MYIGAVLWGCQDNGKLNARASFTHSPAGTQRNAHTPSYYTVHGTSHHYGGTPIPVFSMMVHDALHTRIPDGHDGALHCTMQPGMPEALTLLQAEQERDPPLFSNLFLEDSLAPHILYHRNTRA